MTDDTIRAIVDRHEIADCLLRYARGVDRMDEELVLSAFHPDAVDEHGPATFTPQEFLAWYRDRSQGRELSQHLLVNMSIDLDGDTAFVETYFVAVSRASGAELLDIFGGRYVDRLERRDGAWRIAHRLMIPEWNTRANADADSPERVPWAQIVAGAYTGSRDRDDASYRRTA
jgi:hypothetical protein